MKLVVLLFLVALVLLTFTRLNRGTGRDVEDARVVRGTPVPLDLQLRAQAVTDEPGRVACLQEISRASGLTLRQAALAYDLLRRGERLPDA